jgi:hypothetical protein
MSCSFRDTLSFSVSEFVNQFTFIYCILIPFFWLHNYNGKNGLKIILMLFSLHSTHRQKLVLASLSLYWRIAGKSTMITTLSTIHQLGKTNFWEIISHMSICIILNFECSSMGDYDISSILIPHNGVNL